MIKYATPLLVFKLNLDEEERKTDEQVTLGTDNRSEPRV